MGSWPSHTFENEPSEVKVERKKERKKEIVLMAAMEEPMLISQVVDINRYSTLDKLLRVTAYVQ